MQYESAGKRRDRTISREGKVAMRRALIDPVTAVFGLAVFVSEAV
jgi:hypothetical protein